MNNMFKLTSSNPTPKPETEEEKKKRLEKELMAYARGAVKLHGVKGRNRGRLQAAFWAMNTGRGF